MTWRGENFGNAFKALAKAITPDRPALVHGDTVVTWAQLDVRSDAIACALRESGLKPGDAAGQMLRNGPEYMMAYFGCAKAGVTPVNVNYHYKAAELADIFARFGLRALFHEGEFSDAVGDAIARMDGDPISSVIDVSADNAAWQDMLHHEVPAGFAPHSDPDALFYTATGGTTGMPKAVMWPHAEAWQAFQVAVWPQGPDQPPFVAANMEDHVARAAAIGPDHPASGAPLLLLSPLMHGAGQFVAVIHLLKGGTLATLPTRGFDADAAIDAIRDHGARTASFVGDAFALPLVEALEARGDAAQALAGLRLITSSGAVFSESNKQRLLAVAPQLIIVDALGSSESGGTAITISSAAGNATGGRFSAMPGRSTKIFDENFKEIPPGSDQAGMLGRAGPLPLGYLGEDEKNAQTFPTIDGTRYLMTGDMARYREDGTLEFIGRDNMCINTGGEKVFPEEVEAALQNCDGVEDCCVVGVPDPRFGKKVAAVVSTHGDGAALEPTLDGQMRENLAGYKIPRLYVFTAQSLRLNNGKPDYKTAKQLAEAALA